MWPILGQYKQHTRNIISFRCARLLGLFLYAGTPPMRTARRADRRASAVPACDRPSQSARRVRRVEPPYRLAVLVERLQRSTATNPTEMPIQVPAMRNGICMETGCGHINSVDDAVSSCQDICSSGPTNIAPTTAPIGPQNKYTRKSHQGPPCGKFSLSALKYPRNPVTTPKVSTKPQYRGSPVMIVMPAARTVRITVG